MFQLNRKNFLLFCGHILIVLLLNGCRQVDHQIQSTETEASIMINTEEEIQNFKIKVRAFDELPTILSQKENAKPITSPVQPLSYIYTNGIETEYVDFSIDESLPESTGNYIKIYGLKDKSVENKINKLVYDTTMELCQKDLPPYRGIHSIILDSDIIRNIQVETYVKCNSANILSLSINKFITIQDPENRDINKASISESDVLNINLKTGELIPLSDLFTDNCDYITILNNLVNEYIIDKKMDDGKKDWIEGMYGNDTMHLVRPFEGIKDNQKFYFDDMGKIHLIIDYHMPEFETYFKNDVITIPPYNFDIQQNLALYYRFETWDDSLYDGSIKRGREFLYNAGNQQQKLTSLDFINEEGNASCFFYCVIPEDIENPQLKANFEEKFEIAKTTYCNMLASLSEQHPNDIITMNYFGWVTEMGHYYSDVEEIGYNIGEEYKNLKFSSVYDSRTGKKIELQNCFIENFDYITVMFNIINGNPKTYGYLTTKSKTELFKYLESSQFELDYTCFKFYNIEEDGRIEQCSIPYRDIGIENLVIFN